MGLKYPTFKSRKSAHNSLNSEKPSFPVTSSLFLSRSGSETGCNTYKKCPFFEETLLKTFWKNKRTQSRVYWSLILFLFSSSLVYHGSLLYLGIHVDVFHKEFSNTNAWVACYMV